MISKGMAANPVLKEKCEAVWANPYGDKLKQCGQVALVRVSNVAVCAYCLHCLLKRRAVRRSELSLEARAVVLAFVGRPWVPERPGASCLTLPQPQARPGKAGQAGTGQAGQAARPSSVPARNKRV